jgi:uncharacterized sporulation protein YeaH/YhbH (DUF444 family)
LNSKWKYLRRLLKKRGDISLEHDSSVPAISLPRPRYGFKILVPQQALKRGPKPGTEDERSIGRKELYDYFIKETNIPIIESFTNPEFYVTKEGKTKKGRISQLDLKRTMVEKMKRHIIDGDDDLEDLFDKPFVDSDLIYNRYAMKEQIKRNAVVVLCVDVSGSISDIERIIGKSLIIGLLQFFGTNFDKTTFYLMTHEVEARIYGPVVVEKTDNPLSIIDDPKKGKPILEFSTLEGGGGTSLEQAVEYMRQIKKENPKVPAYLFYSGDLEVDSEDKELFEKAVLNEGVFDFNGFLVYNEDSYLFDVSTIAKKYSVLIMGREIRENNDPADAIAWVFRNLGKHGVHKYEKNR